MHLNLSGKKIFLFGFIAILLIGIPVTIYLVQQQQQTQTQAAKSTTLGFTPESSATAPIQKKVGDSIPLDITVDPGQNLVSFVKLEIEYDPEKLSAATGALVQNTTVFPSVLEGPVYTPGKISVTLSVGSDPTKSIQTKVKAATVTFKALSNTPPGTPTLVSYAATTQALSIGSNDQASENVLSSTAPAAIAIGGDSVTPTDGPIPSPTPTTSVSITPTDTPTPTDFPSSITPTISTSPSANAVPLCSNLLVDRETTGVAPLSLTFTATGTDSNGTISKVTFNYGDGQVSDVTTAGGIGTASVNATSSHTYTQAGTFTAQAILTDNENGISDSGSCKQTITVTATDSATVAPATDTPAPSLPPTGSTEVAMGIGALVIAFIIGGGFLFFFL